MQRLTVLEYKNYRYLKICGLLTVMALLAYASGHDVAGKGGSTWLSYTLGGAAAILVLILLWYGVVRRRLPILPERRQRLPSQQGSKAVARERRLRVSRWSRRHASTLQGWLSAHVYFGLALLAIATLHTGFHFGWNIHTATYFLMVGVVLTGFYGLYAYIRFPRMMTENMGEDSLSSMIADIADLDQLALETALLLPDEIGEVVQRCCRETSLDASLPEKLRGRPWRCATRAAIDNLQKLGDHLDHAKARLVRDVYALLLRKESLLKRVRLEVMYKARLQLWLHIHVPLATGLLAALVAHVTAVFFFW